MIKRAIKVLEAKLTFFERATKRLFNCNTFLNICYILINNIILFMQQSSDSYQESSSFINRSIEELNNKIDQLSAQNIANTLGNQISQLKLDIQLKDSQIVELKKKCESFQSEREKSQKQISQYKQTISTNMTLRQKERLVEKQSLLKQQEEKLLILYNDQKQQLKIIQLQNKFQKEKEQLNKQIRLNQQKLSQKQFDLKQSQFKISQLQSKNSGLQQQIKLSGQQLNKIKEQISSERKDFTNFRIELQKTYKNYQSSFEQSVENKYKFTIQQINSKNQVQAKRLSNLIDKMQRQKQEYQTNINSYLNQLKIGASKNNQLTIQIKKLQQKLYQNEGQLSKYQKNLSGSRQSEIKKAEDYKQQINKLKQYFDEQIKQKLSQLNQQQSKDSKNSDQALESFYKEEISKKDKEINKIKLTLQISNKTIQSFSKKIKRIQDQMQTLNYVISSKDQTIRRIGKVFGKQNISINEQNMQEQLRLFIQQKNQIISQCQNRQAQINQRIQGLLSQNQTIRLWIVNTNVLLQKSQNVRLPSINKKINLKDQALAQAINKLNQNLFDFLQRHKNYFGQAEKAKDKLQDLQRINDKLNEQKQSLQKQRQKSLISINLERVAKQNLQTKVNKLTQIVNKQKQENSSTKMQLIQMQAANITLQQQLQAIQTIRMGELTKELISKSSKCDELEQKVQKYQQDINKLRQHKKTLEFDLENNKQYNQNLLRKKQQQVQSMKTQKEQELNKIKQVIKLTYGLQFRSTDNFERIIDMIKNNNKKQNTNLIVSPIFEFASKERAAVNQMISRFLKIQKFTTTLLFKYDEFYKNFSNYLPNVRSMYDFVVILKLKNSTIFGIVCSGIGSGSKALAFNATTNRSFASQKLNSTSYDSSYLVFGQGQIRFKNNSSLQIVVNSSLFGSRHFSFKKEELIGQGDTSAEAMEVHRINY